MLVRAVYKGVNFHGMLPPGKNSADVEIFEPDTNIKTVQFPARLIYFQPQGSTLLVGEEYEVQNQSTPPKAYFNAQGDFEFRFRMERSSAMFPRKAPRKCRSLRARLLAEKSIRHCVCVSPV